MHIFFESVWKLHIGEIPEKCSITCHKGKIDECHNEDCALYNETIAAIKQNALTVGNPEFLESHFWGGKFEHLNLIEIPPPPDKFYPWPGGYETKETMSDGWVPSYNDPDNSGCHHPAEPITVAILTLPEEKKNTMEISEFKCMTCGTSITKGEYDTFGVCDACYNANYKKQTASGSVAAPKEEIFVDGDFNDSYEARVKRATGKNMIISKEHYTALREALKELLPIVEWFTTEYPMDAENLSAKAIIERARKLISK